MAIVKKISELIPKGSDLSTTDLLIVGVNNGTDYDLKSVTGAQVLGNVVSQTITDGVTTKAPSENVVFDALDLKVDKITGSRLITTAEATILSNTSGVNTGDQDLSGKVDKVAGKGLSTEDYTSAEKSKLSGLSGTNTGDQNLQQVTNLGNNTTHAIVSATLLHSSLFLGTEISTTTLANSKKSSLYPEGYLSLSTTGTSQAILKGSNILNDVTLEFPNKTVGSYTIATTTDLTSKVDSNTAITGATKTKITYDSKGLVTSGADATTADIADSLNKRYVTDANLTVIGNTSGTNTGDETVTTIKTKLGITTLSGSNTGDQDLSTLLVKSNNLSDLTNTTTARSNLGLGSLATQSGTFSGTSSGTNTGDQTFLNARVQSVTSSATVTPLSTNDLVIITAQAVGLTLANPTGTFTEGQALMIRIKDNGTARTIAFDTNYRDIGVTLPTTTVISKTMYLGIIYNSTDTKWDVIGYNIQA